jgi:hypothetical protein
MLYGLKGFLTIRPRRWSVEDLLYRVKVLGKSECEVQSGK